jgi:hypothetical protein
VTLIVADVLEWERIVSAEVRRVNGKLFGQAQRERDRVRELMHVVQKLSSSMCKGGRVLYPLEKHGGLFAHCVGAIMLYYLRSIPLVQVNFF